MADKANKSKIKALWTNASKFARAAFLVVLVFLIAGLCTIGSVSSTGRAYRAFPEQEAVFYLDYQGGNRLDEIWINVGSVYTEIGEDATLTMNYATVPSSSASSISWTGTSRLGDFVFGNIYSASGDGFSGANYNWVRVADLANEEAGTSAPSTSYSLIRIRTEEEMLINEVAFIDTEGNRIPAYVTVEDVSEAYGNWSSRTALRDAIRNNPDDLVYASDSRFMPRQGDSVRSRFTEDEMYSLMQIDNVFLGGQVFEGSVYNIDSDSGPLSVLILSLGVLIFGVSPFGLRFMPLLFTAALVALAYFFGKDVFKSDAFGLLFAALFASGGLALTVGRLGLSLSVSAFFVVLSFFFMYKFYARGVSSERPVHTGLSVLFSGLAFAFAFAVDPKMLFAGLAVLALFILGAVRHHRAVAYEKRKLRKAMSDANAVAETEAEMQENLDRYERDEAALTAESGYRTKLIYAFFFVSFIVGTVLAVMLSSLASYYSYVRFYEADPENPALGVLNLIGRAVADCFTVGNMTSYTAANASNAFGWLIGLKGATLLSASEGNRYLALNVQMNPLMTLTALLGLLFMTVYAVLYAATGGKKGAYASKYAPRIMRVYAVFALGLLASLLSFAFSPNAGASHGMLFSVFYIGFIPLAFYTVYVHDRSGKTKVLGIGMNATVKVLAALLVLYAVVFILMLPMTYGFPTTVSAARYCFGWTSFLNNGFYRI